MLNVDLDKLFSQLKFDAHGLIPAVVQHDLTGRVLMVAYMNKEALEQTIGTGETVFYSRSRQEIWHKGETSGNTQTVKAIHYDCDEDTLLIQVIPQGPACHTGEISCFYRSAAGDDKQPGNILEQLKQVIAHRKIEMPEGSYTTYLFSKGLDKILKKVGEETAEVIIASKNSGKDELIYETADLIYHLLVLLEEKQISLEEIYQELDKRR